MEQENNTPDEIYKKVREGWEESAKYWNDDYSHLIEKDTIGRNNMNTININD